MILHDFPVREIVVAFDRLLHEPATVAVAAPVAPVLLLVTVNLLALAVPLKLHEAGTPQGRPDADKLTLLIETILRSDPGTTA